MTSEAGGRREEGSLWGVLSRPPEDLWPQGLVHHGSRLLLLLGLAMLIAALFPPVPQMTLDRYEVGMVADEAIIAQVPFGVPKSQEELERDREEAAEAVPPTFRYRPQAVDSMTGRLDRFFHRVDEARTGAGVSGIEELLSEVGIPVSEGQIRVLEDPELLVELRETAVRGARELLPGGVVDASQAQLITTDRITLRLDEAEERAVPRDSILTSREFLDRAIGMLDDAGPEMEEILRLVLIRYMEPTYTLDVVATELDRESARRAVATTKADVLAGEAIVRANQQIGPQEVERLEAYQEALQAEGLMPEEGGVEGAVPLLGAGVLNLLLLSVFGLLLLLFRPEVYSNFRWVLLLAILVAAYFGVGAVISSQDFPSELLPVAFVALTAAVLWDGRLALVLALLLAVLTGALPPFAEYRILAVTLGGGAAAALTVRAMRRRAQTWLYIAIISAGYAGVILAFALIEGGEAGETVVSMAWAAGNATASAILAMGFVPVFEWFTRITTDQTLLEWADPNRPLLKRLSMEAPGTYAHTINVANLAEAAANAIGANGLLCRVGMYYHDVGKMLKPQYFVENQPSGRNPHDKLKPDTSATIIREHVTEGLRLAREENVPDVITAFIAEHHGTQKIGFFHAKALEELEEGEGLDSQQFRYPGPRPRSRETAIAMLSDGVESATRTLQDPTPERTRDLIENMVEARIQDGQLDEAPLTLRDIAVIKDQFAKILTGMYHHRIDYPATRHLTESPITEDPAGAAAGASAGDLPPREGGSGASGEE